MLQLTVSLSIKSGLKSENVHVTTTIKNITIKNSILQNDPEVMTLFCNHFSACVIGNMIGNRQSWTDLIREFAAIIDKAFALLVLEIYGMYG